MIKKSLTGKLILVFSAILVAVILLNVVINNLLLARVYRSNKIDLMEQLYTAVSEQYSASDDTNAVVETVKSALSKENLRVFIWDEGGNLVVDSLPLSHQEGSVERPEEPIPRDGNFFREEEGFAKKHSFRPDRMEYSLFTMEVDTNLVIKKESSYTVFSHETSTPGEENTLCLRGYLPHDYRILIQLPLASMDAAVEISAWLMLLVGAAMLIIGVIIVAFTSRTIAKPVKELSRIAKAMENLDFSQKYVSTRVDEIGSLGESINSLSEKLKITIDELFEKNEVLRRDNELKSRIDKMRKEFIANASHELKTPIALISGYAEGLMDNVANDEESKTLYTQVIIEEAARMDYIIRQMLDLMEFDTAEKIYDKHIFPLSEVAGEVVASFELIMKNKGISLSCSFDEDCIVCGDYFRIYQAMANYISNAINHVDENRIIRVCTKKVDDKVIFSVYNSGAAIPERELSRIWERFYKLDKAHTREYGGSGLGLSIVGSIIQLHGGEYGATNLPDGVEFYFRLKKENFHEA